MAGSTTRRAAVVALLGALAATPAAAGAGTSKPKPGTTYTGRPGKIELLTGASGLDLAAFTIPCGRTTARVALNGVALKRTSRGYTFRFRGKAGFTYDDDDNGANGSVTFTGRFSSTARTARGTAKATVKRCGTRQISWSARRAG